MITQKQYQSQAARDAQASGYGDSSYWDYLEQSRINARDYYLRHGQPEVAAKCMTEDLSEALRGNEGI